MLSIYFNCPYLEVLLLEEEKYVSLTMALLESRINLVLMIALAYVSWGKAIRTVSHLVA